MFLTILALTLFPATGSAERHVNALEHSCAHLKAIVKAEKVVFLQSGFYGARFVANKYDCSPSEKTVNNAYLRSADTYFCNPGILCRVKFPGE